ncbi:MAG: type II toxin-antitoxin system YafQ family toxin [Paludibacteraceae bacterium]|nr:type II toxin-antitoxin system YafQ family toxin [Paludibacteraceae bacterium]MBQ6766639.1 type II toxin-antitoxin system YafQ family toxin [Paludibacteraceae bacterium]MDY6374355.1 type II toxin-antitoxin system YafQ family toxin [Bacteroidales bacterium]
MKRLFLSGQFKKDYKRFRNDPQKKKALAFILDLLKNEQKIPPQYRPHLLTGDYKGCMECHVQGDFFLIWMDEQRDIIELLRLGSHSELFN